MENTDICEKSEKSELNGQNHQGVIDIVFSGKIKDDSIKAELIEFINSSEFGNGKLTPVAYNTAWTARIQNELGEPMFPKSLEYLRNDQNPDGSWGSVYPSSLYDRIITTLIVVITLKQWNHDQDHEPMSRGIQYLSENFKNLKEIDEKEYQITAGFEVLFPVLVEQAHSMNLIGNPERFLGHYLKLREDKLRKIDNAEKTTQISTIKAWHFSLEAFGHVYTNEMIKKLILENSLIAGSYCSTAYALFRKVESDESRLQLSKVVDENNGGVPPFNDCKMFGLSWSFTSLIFAGFPIEHDSLRTHLDDLETIWYTRKGLFGAGAGNPPDPDDIACCLFALKQSGRICQDKSVLKTLLLFLQHDYFITYEGERDPSLSSNVNTLITLNEFKDCEGVKNIINRVANWTKAFIIKNDYNFNDKWHMSKYYAMGRALVAFLNVDIDFSKLILQKIISLQRYDGGWGAFDNSTRLETSYSVLAVNYSLRVCQSLINGNVIQCFERAKKYLDNCKVEQEHKFWIEKVLYSNISVDKLSIICASYALDRFEFNQ